MPLEMYGRVEFYDFVNLRIATPTQWNADAPYFFVQYSAVETLLRLGTVETVETLETVDRVKTLGTVQ